MGYDAIPWLEVIHAKSHLDDLSGNVVPENLRLCHPGKQIRPKSLKSWLDGVHGHGMVADQDLEGGRVSVSGLLDLQTGSLWGQLPSSVVLGGHFDVIEELAEHELIEAVTFEVYDV